MTMNIFTGTHIKVELGSASNVKPTPIATDFVEVPEINAFPVGGSESSVVDVKTFNNSFNRVLLGTQKIPEIELAVNLIPDDVTHQKIQELAANQQRAQIRVSYFQDGTHTDGMYLVYQGYFSTSSFSGDKDEVVSMKVTFVSDGDKIGGGLLPIAP